MVLRYVWREKLRTGHSPGHRHSVRLALQAPDGKAQTQTERALLFPRHLKADAVHRLPSHQHEENNSHPQRSRDSSETAHTLRPRKRTLCL